MVDRKLYDVLGVDPSVGLKEIQRSYRILALKLHPDKNGGDKTANQNFQRLQAAYTVLRDPERRKQYDLTGRDPDDDDCLSSFTSFDRITPADIEAFEKRYKGSDEEKDDVVEFYNNNQGDVSKVFECILLAEANECQRFIDLFEELVMNGRIESTPQYTKSIKKLPAIAKRYIKKYKSEESELPGSSSMTDLILAVQANREKRGGKAADFLTQLEEKYSNKTKSKRSKK